MDKKVFAFNRKKKEIFTQGFEQGRIELIAELPVSDDFSIQIWKHHGFTYASGQYRMYAKARITITEVYKKEGKFFAEEIFSIEHGHLWRSVTERIQSMSKDRQQEFLENPEKLAERKLSMQGGIEEILRIEELHKIELPKYKNSSAELSDKFDAYMQSRM